MKPISLGQIAEITGGTLLQGDASLTVTSVEHNSREVKEGALFVPIIGERTDGHNYISSAFEAGAVCTFTSKREMERETEKAYIYVPDTLCALQQFASGYRDMFRIPVIGITGSVGKTTTKEMISDLLAKKYRLVKTIGNWNSQIGVAMMMFHLEDETEMAVIEMGISMPGEMERLVAMAKPCTAVMTNIGVSHIGNLGSRENICREKGNIIGAFPKDGILYVCGNGDGISLSKENINRAEKDNCALVYYGTEPSCEAYADKIVTEQGKTTFYIHIRDAVEKIELSVVGNHYVNNAVVAILIGMQYGVPMEDMKQALYDYRPLSMRGEKKEKNGVAVIDDTYNASPDSVASGLEVLYATNAKGKKIAILGDIFELGERTEHLHRKIGEDIVADEGRGKKLDVLVTVGEASAFIAETVIEKGKNIMVQPFLKKEEAADWLLAQKRKGNLYLVKGSRGMQMDKLVEILLG